MKKRTQGALGVLIVIATMVSLLFLRTRRQAPFEDTLVAAPKKSDRASEALGDDDPKRTPLQGTDERKRALIAEVREIMRSVNQAVNFFGKVVDQDDEPIQNVKVRLSLRYTEETLPGLTDDRFRNFDLETDGQGAFKLTGTEGSVLSIKSLAKEGYESSPQAQNRSFWYWRDIPAHGYKGDAKQPEIFRMWKKQGPETLVAGDRFYGVVPDGRTYAIDLLNERKVEGSDVGDLKISILRPSDVKVGFKYDWSCAIEGVGGGVAEVQGEFMNRAPETGYQRRYVVSASAGDPQWSDRATRRLFLKSNGGKIYGRLEVEIFANYQDKAVFSVKYYANPNGSRNLEIEPQKLTTSPGR